MIANNQDLDQILITSAMENLSKEDIEKQKIERKKIAFE